MWQTSVRMRDKHVGHCPVSCRFTRSAVGKSIESLTRSGLYPTCGNYVLQACASDDPFKLCIHLMERPKFAKTFRSRFRIYMWKIRNRSEMAFNHLTQVCHFCYLQFCL